MRQLLKKYDSKHPIVPSYNNHPLVLISHSEWIERNENNYLIIYQNVCFLRQAEGDNSTGMGLNVNSQHSKIILSMTFRHNTLIRMLAGSYFEAVTNSFSL